MKQDALIGRTIAGKFQIETLVGEGAMGAVYKARQNTLGTTLAIKVLHAHLAGEPMFAARFLREAQLASRVDHPSSMRVIDFGEEADGLLYIAMEYVQGRTLATVIEQECPLPVSRIVDIACQTLAALGVAHDIGVIHRDLKPENIMILAGKDDEGRTHDIVKVCDFGVAKLLESGSRGPSVTAEGLVVGTPEYMSPEQARGETLDGRSDIYAMGVLLFHMMTGKVPFDSSTAFGTAFMQVNDEPTRPRLLNPGADARLEAICLKAMRKRREDRYPSARELRSELRALLGHDDAYLDESEHAPAPPSMPPSRSLLAQMDARPRRTGLVVAGVILAASVVAGGILYPRRSAPGHELVQTTRISSAVVSAAPSSVEPPKVVDTTAPNGPGSDAANETPAPARHSRGVTRINAHARRTTKAHDPALAAEDIPLLPVPVPVPVPVPGAKPIPAAADKVAPTVKPAAAAKPDAAAEKPAAPAKAAPSPKLADPADAPLPNFPIPGAD